MTCAGQVSGAFNVGHSMKAEKIPNASGNAGVSQFLLLNSLMLEKMNEGVILLDTHGNVLHHNRAALPWIAHCQSKVKELGKAIGRISQGTLFPVSIASIFTSALPRADHYLCQNGTQGYAIFIAPRLPVGPRSAQGLLECATCLFPRQAEMYAHDLALLLPHRPAACTVSDEELDFLTQLTSEGVSLEIQQEPGDEKNPQS